MSHAGQFIWGLAHSSLLHRLRLKSNFAPQSATHKINLPLVEYAHAALTRITLGPKYVAVQYY